VEHHTNPNLHLQENMTLTIARHENYFDIFDEASRAADLRPMNEFRELLERSRRLPPNLNSVQDPNFLEKSKIVEKPQPKLNEPERNNDALRPLFRPPSPEVDESECKCDNWLWVKHVIPDPNDPWVSNQAQTFVSRITISPCQVRHAFGMEIMFLSEKVSTS